MSDRSKQRRWIAGVGALLALAGCTSSGGGALGNGAISSIKVAAVAGEGGTPLDAVPSPDGSVSYFTTSGPERIYRTSNDPDHPVPVDTGRGFTAIRGISISLDGARLFATDASAVMSLPAGGGEPAPVAGTEGTRPRGLDVVDQRGVETLYFTGIDPADGLPTVFAVPARGGARSTVVKGAPLVDPDGVAVAAGGTVFVTDHGKGTGAAYRLDAGGLAKVAAVEVLGDPGGVALTQDESVLLVSSKDAGKSTAQVLLIDLKTLKTGIVDKVISQNKQAGGLHRAAYAKVFAWAGVSKSGKVYQVDP